MGFKDPASEYPRNTITETHDNDVSRNATGKHILHRSTTVFTRHIKRITGIPWTTGDQWEKWDEVFSAWDAKYPFNKVLMQSECNHIIEVDDTEGSERMNYQHKVGTYEEIDANGSRAVKIFGDDFEIVVGQKMIYIKGDMKMTVDGDVNWLFRRNFTLEVMGDTKLFYRGNVEDRTSGWRKDAVKGDYEHSVCGEYYCTGYKLGSFKFQDDLGIDAQNIWENSGKAVAKEVPKMPNRAEPAPNNRKFRERTRDIRNHGAS
jgi:hypothetical protein